MGCSSRHFATFLFSIFIGSSSHFFAIDGTGCRRVVPKSLLREEHLRLCPVDADQFRRSVAENLTTRLKDDRPCSSGNHQN